jgi:hypothetical protein
MKTVLFWLSGFISLCSAAQTVVINEVDADQPGADSTEFVELYGAAGTSLDGYVLVFFNGSDPANASYQSIDLTGNVIPASGFFVVGNVNVPNVNIVINDNSLQNGADAVVLYNNTTIDLWPNGSEPSITNAVDAVVYGTADSEDIELMTIFASGQTQLDEGAANNTNSLSRLPNGGAAFLLSLFIAQAPTPGASNGGGSVGITAVESTLSVYPNPSMDLIKLESSEMIGEIQVINACGVQLMREMIMDRTAQLNVASLPVGVYTIRTVVNGKVSQRNWVKN